MNEGDLYFGRLYGADASNNAKRNTFFRVRDVPEVFGQFDDFSYEFGKLPGMDAFRQNALRNDIFRANT